MNARLLVVVVALLGSIQPALCVEHETVPAKANPAAVAQWRKTLLEWREEYFSNEGENPRQQWEQGRVKIAVIDDRAAIPAIVSLLRTEKHPQFRRALIVPLINMGGKDAVACLVKWSVEDNNPLLREEAAKGLVGKDELAEHLDTYIAYLKSPKYVATAAEGLSRTKLAQPISTLDEPDAKLTKALINALRTVTARVVPYRITYDTGWVASAPHTPGDTAAFRAWGTDEGMAKVKTPVPIPAVLKTLQEYSGRDYQYDESQWNSWLAQRMAD